MVPPSPQPRTACGSIQDSSYKLLLFCFSHDFFIKVWLDYFYFRKRVCFPSFFADKLQMDEGNLLRLPPQTFSFGRRLNMGNFSLKSKCFGHL